MNASDRPDLTLDAFEALDVDPARFDHEAHVYVAWQYLERFELDAAIGRFTSTLRRLTRKLGVPDKYHATISWFYLLLIAERRSQGERGDWLSFRSSNADLLAPGGQLLHRYYSRERLDSEAARRQFVLPDRFDRAA